MSPRNQFRIDAEDRERQVRVELVAESGPALPGELTTIGTVGANVRFAADLAPALALGQQVALRFSGPRLEEPVIATVSVQTRTDDGDRRGYGFWFVERGQVESRLLPRLEGLFNRRNGYRVQPDPCMPVLVTLESVDKRARLCGPLLSISTSGLGMRVNFEDEAAFAGSELATACFALPGRLQDGVRVNVRIRQRRTAGRHVQLGLVFEGLDTPGQARNERAIREYVVARQGEILRRRAS